MTLKQQYGISTILFFICILANAQNLSKNLEGKVESDSLHIADVHVINKTTKKATITNTYGYFSISAKLNDTILFSSVQFEKFQLVVNAEILENEMITVTLKEVIFELDEVLVTPYNLSGDIHKDIQSLKIENQVSSSSLGLPNANVKKLTVNERKLFLAMQEQALHRLLDEITGHNRKLRELVHVDNVSLQIRTAKEFYPDSLYSQQLKIPLERIDDFMYFCAADPKFSTTVESKDKLRFLEFLEMKSPIYRKHNDLD